MDTIRNYNNPPAKVVTAMRPIYHMLTKQVPQKGKPVDWVPIKAQMQKDFIKQILELKADEIPDKVKALVLS